jgi:alcohol dehydrogenase (cytochrome c)
MLSFNQATRASMVAAASLMNLGLYAQAPAPPAPPMPAILQNYAPVTEARLRNPEPGNWLSIRGTRDGMGYSPLNQITADNVSKLKLVWSLSTGEKSVHEAPPLINNGVMFVMAPFNVVEAIDAKTGNILWRKQRARPTGSRVPHETNRGAALYGDKLYVAGGEGVLYALDAKTGREVWSTVVGDNKEVYYTTLAPLAAGGVIMLGTSGGEFGIRGFVAAYDPETGAQKWKTYMIPAPGEPGSETWPKGGDQWKTGGASVWVTGNYDPDTNIAYWGTGNGGPWMGDKRPGDNLYTASTVALDVATGKIKGHFQYNPNESFDWDEVSPPLLIDYTRNGRTVKGLVNAGRDGYLWFLDRGPLKDNGQVGFVEGRPFVVQNVFKSLDPKTGRPDVDPANKPVTGKKATYCPGLSGGKNWFPAAFSPQTRLFYLPANNNLCTTSQGVDIEYTAGQGFTGVQMDGTSMVPGTDNHVGELQAWNVDTGQKVWTHNYTKSPNWGGVLTTAGGLVFHGGTSDRKLHAFDAKTGKLLWDFPTSSGIEAPPSTFMVDGKQYIAIASGWGADARGMQAQLNRLFPGEYPEVPDGGSVWVFALE